VKLDTVLGDLSLWEGVYGHMYLDTKGLVTTAIGHLLRAPDDALTLPWALDGWPASPAAVREAWRLVKALPPAMHESYYASATRPRLTQEQCFDLARARLEGEFLPWLRERLPGFDSFPDGAQRAVLDVAWNYGTHGLGATHTLWPQLVAHDWKGAAETALLLSSRPLRNEWRRARFLEAG
jgi:GH24 family phage-related lysozyme (muramidase)